jgi:hypothetical protein
MAGINRNPPPSHTIRWTHFCSGSRNGGRGRVAVSFHQSSLMAAPKALVLGCNTHGPAPWVPYIAARGEEEAGGKRESAMCSQTLRGAAVGAVRNGSQCKVRTTQ